MAEKGVELSEKARQDYELVKSALQGDEKAFARLLNKYKDAIYFMLLKMPPVNELKIRHQQTVY